MDLLGQVSKEREYLQHCSTELESSSHSVFWASEIETKLSENPMEPQKSVRWKVMVHLGGKEGSMRGQRRRWHCCAIKSFVAIKLSSACVLGILKANAQTPPHTTGTAVALANC